MLQHVLCDTEKKYSVIVNWQIFIRIINVHFIKLGALRAVTFSKEKKNILSVTTNYMYIYIYYSIKITKTKQLSS